MTYDPEWKNNGGNGGGGNLQWAGAWETVPPTGVFVSVYAGAWS